MGEGVWAMGVRVCGLGCVGVRVCGLGCVGVWAVV